MRFRFIRPTLAHPFAAAESKSAAISALAVVRGDFDTALVFFGSRGVEPVVEFGPLCIARVEFFVGEFTRVRTPPCLGGEAPQGARPAAFGVLVAFGMQAGEGVGDGAPCAEEVGFRELFEWRGEGAAKFAAGSALCYWIGCCCLEKSSVSGNAMPGASLRARLTISL